MKKIIAIHIIIFILCVVVLSWMIDNTFKGISEDVDKISQTYIGERVVLDGDTSVIIDYRYLSNTFETSKGSNIDGDNIDKFIIKTK